MLHWRISGSIWNESPHRLPRSHLVCRPRQSSEPRFTCRISDPTNDLLLSAGSIWEIGIKVGLGKLVLTQPFKPWMNQAISDLDVTVLPLSVEYVDVQSKLPRHHGDPFDRLIVAQAMIEQVSIISADANLDAYDITRIW